MSWFPSLKVTPKIEQRESYWGLLPRFEPTAKVTKQPGKVTSFFGALTRLDGDGGETISDMAEAEGRKLQHKAIAKVEQAHAKALKLSGNRFEVKDRDGHPRGYFPTLPPAQARADEVGGFVTDRLEGRRIYSARGEPSPDVPDAGSDELEDWEMDW